MSKPTRGPIFAPVFDPWHDPDTYQRSDWPVTSTDPNAPRYEDGNRVICADCGEDMLTLVVDYHRAIRHAVSSVQAAEPGTKTTKRKRAA